MPTPDNQNRKGLGRFQRKVLAALADPRQHARDTRTLAIAVYGTNLPTPAQRRTLWRAVHALRARGLVVVQRRVRPTIVHGTETAPTPDGGTTTVSTLTVKRIEMLAVALAPVDTCRMCGAPIEQSGVARARVYCSARCRIARHHANVRIRRRRARATAG